MATTSDLLIHDGLTVVVIDGFEPEPEGAGASIDLPGSANWLVDQLGCKSDIQAGDEPGLVLWCDYDCAGEDAWRFSVLVDSDDAAEVRETAEAAGYRVVSEGEVTRPERYGDGSGTVALCQHPDGWIVIER